MPELTRDILNDARIEGYTNDEIIAHVTKDRPDILDALEEGYSLEEIADHFSKNAPTKPEAEKQEDPSLGRVAAGLAADIAVAEGAKYAGAGAGAALGSAGFSLGPVGVVTVPAGAAAGYVTGALGGGWTGSILAQKIEGAKEINYGRATVDTLLNLIPAVKVGKAGGKLLKASTALAKRPIRTGMALGAVATPTYMAVDEIQDRKDYTLEDYLKATGTSMALGAGLGLAERKLTNGILKIRNKTPDEINQLIAKGDPTTIELVDTLTAGVTPQDVKMAPASVAEYIQGMMKGGAATVAPSRVLGYDATTAAKKAQSSIEAVQGTAGNVGKQIDDYLAKNPQYRDDAIAVLDGESRPNLPAELLDNLLYGRNKIRTEQQRMINMHNSGEKILPNDRAELIEDSLNRGDYLTRAYRFFQDPNYKPSKEKYDALKNSLVADGMDEANANKYLAELQAKMKGNPEDFSNFMRGPGTPNVLKKRKDVSPELEDFLGLIKEPGQRVGTTMSILNRMNEYAEADAKIAKALFDSGAAVKAANVTQGLQPLKLKRGNAMLNGEELYVDPAVQTAINKIYAGGIDEQLNLISKRTMQDIYETAVSGLKSAKVLGNLSSYLIQAPSNLAITLAAGMNPFLGLGNAVRMSLATLAGTKAGSLPIIKKVANQAPPLTMEKFEDLRKRGMITGNVEFEDLKAGLQGKRLGRAFQKVTDVPGRVYSLLDNMSRIVNYENNSYFLKTTMPTATEEQIKEMAARMTTKSYPNYESVSPELKALSRAGVMPQFITYSLEFVRSQLGQAKLIKQMADGTLPAKLGDEFKNIPVNSKAMKKEAAKRLAAMTTAYAAATYGINQFNRNTFTEEQERAYRDTVAADFERDKPLLLYKKKDGSIGSINTAYYLPQTIPANLVMSILRGEDVDEGTDNLLKLLGSELVGEGSFAAQGLSSLVSGRDFKTGDLVSNDPNVVGNRLDRLADFGKEFVPTTITTMQKPGKTMQEKLTRQAGIREETRTIPEGFGFKARGIHEALGNIKSTMSGHEYKLRDGKISQEEYNALIANEQNNYAGNMQKMLEHVKNLRTLGETDETIVPMLQKAKFSSIDTLNLLEGKIEPYNPVKEKTASEVLDELVGANDSETQNNIRGLVKKDPIMGNKVLAAYKERARTKGIFLTPKETLLAGLPTNEKVERVFPQIQTSSNPDGEIRRLFKKKILTETDVKAIEIRRKLGSN
jgi:hypothetical protein